MLERNTPPPFIIPEFFTIPRADTHRMPNGNTIYSINSPTDALLRIDVYFPAGRIKQPKPSIAALCLDMLFEGTRKRDALEMAEALDYFGSYTDYSVMPEWASVTLYTLNRYLPDVLPLFTELLTEPAFDKDEFEQLIDREIQDLQVGLEKNTVLATRETLKNLWGETHPWGMLPTEKNYRSLKSATIREFYDKYYDMGSAKIFVAGNIDASVIDSLSKAFGSFVPKSTIEPFQVAASGVNEKGVSFVEKPGSLQAALRVVRKHIPRSHPDYNDTSFVNLLLGGYFGSRLMDNLREEKGYTYGIGSHISDYSFGSDWTIATEVKNDVKDDAVREIFNEMQRLCDEKVGEEELTIARNYTLGRILRNLDGAYQILRYAETSVLQGYDYEVFYKNFERIKSITPDEIQAAARKYLKKEDWLTVVCGSTVK